MIGPRDDDLKQPATPVSFWPGLIDLVTSALMVFLLLSFIQTVLNVDELEALVTRGQQAHFLELFEEEFRDEIDRGMISVERHLNFLQLTFSDQVLFRSGKYRLQPLGRRMLSRCADLFAEASASGYRQIQVEGHTDSVPVKENADYPSDNWELSTARAISVVRYLTRTGSLHPEVFSANGYADQRPVASNGTVSGRQKNRRIEIRLFFALPKGEEPVESGPVSAGGA
jgi:chemotaxis protein MotB